MSSKRTVSAIPTHPEASVEEAKDWLTAEEFTHIEGMPGTARGARMRLEKLASLHPEIRRKGLPGKVWFTILAQPQCRLMMRETGLRAKRLLSTTVIAS